MNLYNFVENIIPTKVKGINFIGGYSIGDIYGAGTSDHLIEGTNEARIYNLENYLFQESSLFEFKTLREKHLIKTLRENHLIIIKEIETSIHYTLYRDLLKMLINSYKYKLNRNKIKLFITTHSYEFIETIAKNNDIFTGVEDEFNFITLNKYEEGNIIPSFYNYDDFRISVLQDKSELRGS